MAKKGMGFEIDVDDSDVRVLFDALRNVDAELRKNTNAELRLAAKECAAELASMLKRNTVNSPAPQTRLVELSVKVKSDRVPIVTVGGTRKVGRAYQSRKGGKKRAVAGALLWGVEFGDKHGRFAPRNESGYWIRPTVAEFSKTGAIDTYKRAVVRILNSAGVL